MEEEGAKQPEEAYRYSMMKQYNRTVYSVSFVIYLRCTCSNMGTNQPGPVVATVSTGTGYSRYVHVAANRLLRLYKE